MTPEILNSLKEALPVLATIFVAVFVLILIIRLSLKLLFVYMMDKYRHLKKNRSLKKKKKKNYEKEEDELIKQIPKAHSAVRAGKLARLSQSQNNDDYNLIASQEQQIEKEELNEVKIVDMVKPMGFWTSMILGQKLSYLIQSAQTINKRGKEGFWVSMIEAQEQAAGRQHGRTR